MPTVTIIEELLGRTIRRIEATGDQLKFHTKDLTVNFYHSQDCCEAVYIYDICGDLIDLIGDPLLEAEVVIQSENPTDVNEENLFSEGSQTWTFYKFSTIKGTVTVRWFGTSNGYYSEEVSMDISYI